MKTLAILFLAAGLAVAGYYVSLLVAPFSVLNIAATPWLEVAYGTRERQRMDVYQQARLDAPTVVFFHGGNWDTGAKDQYRFVATNLTQQGFRVVVPNYRLGTFPTFMEDAALAVAEVRRRFGENDLFVMGHSAGAHIAALLALDPRYLEAVGLDRCEAIAGWIGLSGPYDFLPLTSERTKRVFPPETRAASQPLAFADAPAPPALLIHGTGDETVHAEDTVLMGRALERAGVPVRTVLLEGKGHRDTVAAFGRGLGWIADVRESVREFVLRRSFREQKGCQSFT